MANQIPFQKLKKSIKFFNSINIKPAWGYGATSFISLFAEISPLAKIYIKLLPFFVNTKKTYKGYEHLRRSLKTYSFKVLLFCYYAYIKNLVTILSPENISFYPGSSNFLQDNPYINGKNSLKSKNFLYRNSFEASVFKLFPIPSFKLKEVFIYDQVHLEDLFTKQFFNQYFYPICKNYEAGKFKNECEIVEQFKSEQELIISSIYSIDKTKIGEIFFNN